MSSKSLGLVSEGSRFAAFSEIWLLTIFSPTALHFADKFLNEQQIFVLIFYDVSGFQFFQLDRNLLGSGNLVSPSGRPQIQRLRSEDGLPAEVHLPVRTTSDFVTVFGINCKEYLIPLFI